MSVDLEKLRRHAYLTISDPDMLQMVCEAAGEIERLVRERNGAFGAMITLAEENAEHRAALGRLVRTWPAHLTLADPSHAEALLKAEEVLERFQPDPEMVQLVREDLRRSPCQR